MNKILIHIILVLGAIWMMLPFFWMASTSLKTQDESLEFPPSLIPKQFVFSNFSEAFKQVNFTRYFINTIIMTLGSISLIYFTTVLAAYAFARLKFFGREILFTLFLAMMMIPMPVYLAPSYVILSKFKFIDTFWALIIPWGVNIFAIFLLRQHFKSLPQELFDAAKMDGLNHWQIIRYIVIPLSKPVLITIGIFEVVTNWNSFLWPLIVTHSDAMRTIQTGLAYFAQAESTNYPLLCAASTFTTFPLIILYFFLQRQIMESYVRTGLKE
jgi:multiple sugar transport system permease protein|uniref:Carbohydrate ABC transporter permease n=1 Tax=candidate division WOR-3 bacterium TaxID=2052148 RepID=A0A7V3RHP9_UNCW3